MDPTDLATAFYALEGHREDNLSVTIADLFAEDPKRFDDFHIALDDVLFDFSKQRISRQTLALLLDLARAAKVEERRAALFAGEIVNPTEARPAMHMALRNLGATPMFANGSDVMPEVFAERQKMLRFAEDIRGGAIKSANGAAFTDIVNIGIGGSDLGPAMAAKALTPFIAPHLSLHFVANVDGSDLGDLLPKLPLETTLFVVCSKTFTTLETLTNAAAARKILVEKLGEAAVAAQFCAVSTALDKVADFGIAADRIFGFWDWVGGRYSIWSSIGLSLAIGIGAEKFEKFLLGGQDIDKHFCSAPLEKNVPVLMALIAIWSRNFCGSASQAIIPYDQRLARLPAYLQQLEMESNGKSVLLDGASVEGMTAPIIFGEPGTNGQHAFFQLFHQGTEIVPVDFFVAAQPFAADPQQHQLLVANCLAQSQALMLGRSQAEVEQILRARGLDADEIARLAPHKVFAGNRPSSTFLYKRLSPRVLGQLLALYEHKVFVQSVIWDIDPFDQWGVELGKELALRLAPIVADGKAPLDGLDGSTAGLVTQIRKLKKG
ncbi:glucose-6-phosphate isomerase [Methylovirgula sp. HY1]|uniref:glucose-6-phosphate isomerase n=1 Tax=Methylovirgula sp. HY1 TaxID=2822761 RepID=UPI001C5B53DE|nr:glucose-6-phosphate isomerase [Methylovirgula sp. HY1]QXX75296.1 Glucose-6-phosphate isomerase [Methylovirgula sp. HY1]